MSGIISALELIVSMNNGQAITGLRAVGHEVNALETELSRVGNASGISRAATQIEREKNRIAKATLQLEQINEDVARKELSRDAARSIQLAIDETRLEGRNPNSKGTQLIELGIEKRGVTEAALDETDKVRAARQIAAAEDEVSQATVRRAQAEKLLAAETSSSSRGTVIANGIARNGLIGLGVAIVGSAGVAAQFDKTMRDVNSIQIEAGESAEKSAERFKQQSNAVVELSRTVPQSANNLAKGLYEIASSGFQGAAGLQVLDVAAKAATAGVTTTDTAARAIVSVLNSYGLSASSASDVSDTLFQTVKDGVLRFDELATALTYTVSISKAAGISYGEMGAAIAALTRNGIQGARSGTIYANVISKIITPSKELSALFKANGFASGAAALDSLKFVGVLDLIRNATGGTASGLSQLFHETRAFRGVAALTANDGKILHEEIDRIGTSSGRAGATQRTFQEQMKATANRVKVSINEIAADAIKIGQAFLPTVEAVVSVLAKLADVLTSNRAAISVVAALLAGQLTKGYLVSAAGALGLAKSAGTAAVALAAEGAAAEGAAAATGLVAGLLGTLATGGLILALGAIAKGFSDAGSQARNFVEDAKAGNDLATTSGLSSYIDALREAAKKSDELNLKRDKGFSGGENIIAHPFLQIVREIQDIFGDTSGELLSKKIRSAQAAMAELESVTVRLETRLGVAFTPGTDALANFQDNIAAAAKSLDIDLTKPLTIHQIDALAAAMDTAAASAGASVSAFGDASGAFDEMAKAADDATQSVGKFASTAEEAFSKDFKIESNFSLPDPGDIQKKIEAAKQKIKDIDTEQADVAAARDDARSKRDLDKKIERAKRDLDAAQKVGSKADDTFKRTYESEAVLSKDGNETAKAAARRRTRDDNREAATERRKAAQELKAQHAQERVDDLVEKRDHPRVNPGDARRDSRLKDQRRDAAKELSDLQKQALPAAPSTLYSKKLDADLALATKFRTQLVQAVARGLNESAVGEIQLLGPKNGSAVLQGILSDTTNKTLQKTNSTKIALDAAATSVKELARIRALAFTPIQGDETGALDRRKTEFKTATSIADFLSRQPVIGPKLSNKDIAKRLGITPDELKKVSNDFAIILNPEVNAKTEGADFAKKALKDGLTSAEGIRDALFAAANTKFANLPNIFGIGNGVQPPAGPALPVVAGPPLPLQPNYVAPLPPTPYAGPTLPPTRVVSQPSAGARVVSQDHKIDNSITINAEKIDYADLERTRHVQQRKAALTGRRFP